MRIEPARIETALHVAAQIVARDGPTFLPVFLRLEQEVEVIAGRNSALERALALGGERRGAD